MESPNSIMSSPRVNFEFGFNDADFSDRILQIEIIDGDSFDSKSDSERCSVFKVKTINICSLLLAGNSPFFHKLFKNGMNESKQRDATLRISASEEAGVMEVLTFMYTNTLTATSTPDLLGVLVSADKFEARDCVRYCSELLQKIPMTLEYALLYLELPPSVSMYEQVQPLMGESKKCLLAHFEDISKSQEEALTLPLSAFVVLLGSDKLLVDLSGDDVYEFILKWARAHYPQLEKRREILAKNLIQFVRFRYMSSSKLKEVLVCPDLDSEDVSKLMLEAFIMMVELPYWQNIYASNKCQVIKVERSEPPQPHCVVYFDIKKEDCRMNLVPPHSGIQYQSFCLGGEMFYFWYCRSSQSFVLHLTLSQASQRCSVDLELDVMSKSSMKFENKRKTKIKYSGRLPIELSPDLSLIPWTDLMCEDSDYFVDGILHLRADLTFNLYSVANPELLN